MFLYTSGRVLFFGSIFFSHFFISSLVTWPFLYQPFSDEPSPYRCLRARRKEYSFKQALFSIFLPPLRLGATGVYVLTHKNFYLGAMGWGDLDIIDYFFVAISLTCILGCVGGVGGGVG